MTTTDKAATQKRRKPTAIELTILYGWHAVFSGAFIVAYVSGDEDTYAMHQFAGYLLLAALSIRLIAAVAAPVSSPLRLRRPTLTPFKVWLAALFANNGAADGKPASLPRRPLFALMAAALLISIGIAAASGAVADFLPFIEDVHEAMGELALWIVLGHVAIVAGLHALPRMRQKFVGRGLATAGKQC